MRKLLFEQKNVRKTGRICLLVYRTSSSAGSPFGGAKADGASRKVFFLVFYATSVCVYLTSSGEFVVVKMVVMMVSDTKDKRTTERWR